MLDVAWRLKPSSPKDHVVLSIQPFSIEFFTRKLHYSDVGIPKEVLGRIFREDAMEIDLKHLYKHMYRSRLFEQVVQAFWEEGLISGEMHVGYGEEAVAAGIVCQVKVDRS